MSMVKSMNMRDMIMRKKNIIIIMVDMIYMYG